MNKTKDLTIDASCFCHVHSFYFSKPGFTLSHFPLLSFSVPYSDCLDHYPCSCYRYRSYLYTKSSFCDFSLLLSLLTNHFCLLQTLFRGTHYPSCCVGSTSTTFEHVQHFLSLPLHIPRQILTHFHSTVYLPVSFEW